MREISDLDFFDSLVAYTGDIVIEPWKRAIVMSEQHRLTFPLARTSEREKRYKWIGPILKDRFAFAVQASDTTVFNGIDDFKKLTIGVNRGAPTETRLEKLGFGQIAPVSMEGRNLQKLMAGRIDAWYTTALMIKSQLKQLGIGENRIKVAFYDLNIAMYITASPDVDDGMVSLWQEKLDELKSDGSYQSILEKYGIDAE